ncbi:ABC transporter ATP-binding protein [Microbacterium sp. RD1]|uniref:ABC transporter ATP-binding protein n=1 Tax=Microbacterium sp. RD1 TaxID=3457313 RepID=UPI003FA574F9
MSSPLAQSGTAVLVVMRVVSTLELVSLLAILTNRFTVHIPAVTSTGGPVHGVLYVSTVVFALLLPFPRSAKWLAVVPGIGGLLALWQAGRVARRERERPLPPRRAGRAGPLTAAERDGAAVLVDGAVARLSKAATVGPLSFAAPRGRITGIIGPNGAGKTTALRMIAGLVAPLRGTVRVGGEGPTDRVGALLESPAFLPSLTARANLLVLTRLAGWGPAHADEALRRVGLEASADARVATFSLGMKQRLGLAAALLGSPSIVILDEPTNGLDPRGVAELRTFLRALADDGVTILVSSHALDDVHDMSDHLVAVDAGEVFFAGSPAAMIASQPATIRCTVSDAGDLDAVELAVVRAGFAVHARTDRSVIVAAEADAGPRLNSAVWAAGVVLAEIAPERPSLEEVFLALTAPGPDAAADSPEVLT